MSKTIPIKGKRNILVTSALPYVNNVPHLGNLIGCVLSADVYARYCKQRGYNTLYICGTDEYGTATETKARKEGVSPKEICDKYWKLHKEIYDWFSIDFDYFGRTSTPKQTEIAQSIFLEIHKKGLFVSKVVKQFYCDSCEMFLADRYVIGTCPSCKFEGTRGDQCEKCGKLFQAIELLAAKCSQCSKPPNLKSSKHLFLDLPKMTGELEKWVNESIKTGKWSGIAKSITKGWLTDGLQPRCITRDLKWGTQVPLEEYKDKVFYVWFDAPIGYISITANYTDDWKLWWNVEEKDEYNVEYYQFLAKDNVPFHAIIFPSTLLGTSTRWKLVNSICSTHYLNYEEKKFSKTHDTGVFGDHAKNTNIPPEVWRYYLLTNRPEQQDTQFFWTDLREKNNNELLKNLGNFVNRSLKFCASTFEKVIPKYSKEDERDKKLEKEVNELLKRYIKLLEGVKIKEALHVAMLISKTGNQYLQDCQPWALSKTDKDRCGSVINYSIQLVHLVISVLQPYLPNFARKVLDQLNLPQTKYLKIGDTFDTNVIKGGHVLGNPTPIFRKLGDLEVKKFRKQYGGKDELKFSLNLKVGEIKEVNDHAKNERLYIIKVDTGEKENRVIVAGVKKNYKKEELIGKRVIVACNLKEKDFGDFKSNGMLLAESKKRTLKVLEVNDVPIGNQVIPQECELNLEEVIVQKQLKNVLKRIKVDEDNHIHIDEHKLFAKKKDETIFIKSQLGKGARIS